MRFWDSSAIIPLLVAEPPRDALLDLLQRDPTMIVWWGTLVECASAIARRERERALGLDEATGSLERLRLLAAAWQEVLPSEAVRGAAQRLLRVHDLRAADALQLAAADVASEHEPPTLELVSVDARLSQAASREGFRVLRF